VRDDFEMGAFDPVRKTEIEPQTAKLIPNMMRFPVSRDEWPGPQSDQLHDAPIRAIQREIFGGLPRPLIGEVMKNFFLSWSDLFFCLIFDACETIDLAKPE
jgi:hypothetical protein